MHLRHNGFRKVVELSKCILYLFCCGGSYLVILGPVLEYFKDSAFMCFDSQTERQRDETTASPICSSLRDDATLDYWA